MTVNFQSSQMQRTYSDRAVGEDWRTWCEEHLSPQGKDVVDVGCGGGIYARGFCALGAKSVTAVDMSTQYVDEAREASRAIENIRFTVGSATDTTLADECADRDGSVDHLACNEIVSDALAGDSGGRRGEDVRPDAMSWQ